MSKFEALAAKAASTTNMTVAQAGGGGDYVPPAAGPALVRFVGYVELGKQKVKYANKPEQIKDKVQLIFELVGKRHPPRETDAGPVPHRIVVEENYSLNEKANFFKLFTRMNYKQDKTHFVQMLGQGFKAEVIHDTWTGRDGKPRTDAVLRNEAGYTIAPPRKEDEDSETGWVDVAVPPAVTPLKAFVWEHSDLDDWASLFIEGEYPERKDDKGVVVAKAKSKNVIQDRIKNAVNFQGSNIYTLLAAAGQSLDIPKMDEQDEGPAAQAAEPPKSQPSTTPLLMTPLAVSYE